MAKEAKERQARIEAEKLERQQKLEELNKLRAIRNKQLKEQESKNNENNPEKYNGLDDIALLAEVKLFAKKNGLLKKRINKNMLNDRFGKENIKRLIDRSYLISIGKDITFGNE